MLQNKKISIILSLLIAIVMWLYVMGEVNPTTTKTFSDIKVQVQNIDTLEQNGLAIAGGSDFTVDITVEGKRSAVKSVKESGIDATIDVFGYKKGVHEITVTVTVPDDVKVKDINESKIRLKIEKLISVNKPINVVLEGESNPDIELGDVAASPKEIEVKGAESTVNKVAYVNAPVSAEKLSSKTRTVSAKPEAVDKSGKIVEGITLSADTVEVKAALYQSKTVPLDVDVKGTVASSYQVKDITVPKDITIRGPEKLLKDIEKIKAPSVDISNVTATTTIAIKPELPKGVELANESKGIGVKVVIEGLSTKTLTFNGDDITFDNLTQGLSAVINTAKVKVTVSGSNDILEGVSADDFTLSVDLEGLTAGNHSVTLTTNSDKDFNKITTEPKKVQVTIENQ